ncbi:MAG: hypothetical protein R3C19_27255 [Planctomycetaceae bacterium]
MLTAKPDDCDLWKRYAIDAGREHDLIVFSDRTDNKLCFNFLDYQSQHAGGGGLVFNLVSLVETILQSQEKDGGKSSSDPFWTNSVRMLLRNGFTLLKLANDYVSMSDLQKLVLSAPTNPDQVEAWEPLEEQQEQLTERQREILEASKAWHSTSYCCDVISLAMERAATDMERHDVNHATEFWCVTWPNLPHDTRQSVAITFLSLADYFLTGSLRELFTTGTDVSPLDCLNGKIIVVDLPVLEYQTVGVLAASIWKYLFQLTVTQRRITDSSRPVFLWADEAQLTLLKTDTAFATVARGFRCATVYLTQNLDTYYHALSSQHPHQAKVAIDSLTGNLNTKIFQMNTSPTTNTWASELIGKEWVWHGANISTGTSSKLGEWASHTDNVGAQRVLKQRVDPIEFTRLATGGPQWNWQVSAYVFQGGRRFDTSGENFLLATFSQDFARSSSLPDEEPDDPDTLTVSCPHCDSDSDWSAADRGHKAVCPDCRQSFRLPG